MCKHEHLKTVTKKKEEHLYCIDCGIELPMSYLVKEEPKTEEKPKRGRKRVTE